MMFSCVHCVPSAITVFWVWKLLCPAVPVLNCLCTVRGWC